MPTGMGGAVPALVVAALMAMVCLVGADRVGVLGLGDAPSPPEQQQQPIRALAMDRLKVGFIGGGQMAEAMLSGMLNAGLSPDRVMIGAPPRERRKYMEETYKVKGVDENWKVLEASDVVVIAVKPQLLEVVLKELADKVPMDANPLLISVIAGKTLATFAKYLSGYRIARVMPNTPSLVGVGASCYVLNSNCRDDDASVVEAVMGSCGIVERLGDEKLLDAVTGVSGSGPAYVYLMIEAMSDGGVRMGLPRAVATRLAAQTVLGAGKMVIETGKHPGVLKDAVTSPGGTTIAGIHALENGAFRGTVINAVEATTKRSQELGRPAPP